MIYNNYEPEVFFILSTLYSLYFIITNNIMAIMSFSSMLGMIIIKYWMIDDGLKE